jgi:hypothetical protein
MGNKKIATTFTSLSTRHPPIKRKIREEDILNLEGRRKSNFKPPKKIQFQVTAGNNHQKPEWTFAGTVEVTCNLFSIYVSEKFCKQPLEKMHPDLSSSAFDKRVKEYLQKPDFEKWKTDPYLALWMYILIKEEFGWEPFRQVFKEYQSLKDNESPKEDQEKRDQWMIRMSLKLNKNLAPYFKAWGIPVTKKAVSKISNLPLWMPKEMI